MQTSFHKKIASFLIFLIVNQLVFPSISLAITSGPIQPELQSFQPAGSSQMVDLFTGDFSYNIPLFELPGPDGGYPVNLFYNSVTNPEDEASSVGLGWNLGIGSITRQMRGLPDDFNGETIQRKLDMKPDATVGVSYNGGVELGGRLGPVSSGLSLGMTYTVMHNSYRGFGLSVNPHIGVSMGFGCAKLGAGFGITLSTMDGSSSNLNFSAGVGLSSNNELAAHVGAGLNLGFNFSSREGGLMSRSLGISASAGYQRNSSIKIGAGVGRDAFSFVRTPYTPQIMVPTRGENTNIHFTLGVSPVPGIYAFGGFGGFISKKELIARNQFMPAQAYGAMYHQNSDENSLQDFNRENDGEVRYEQPNLAIPSFTTDVLSVNGQGIGGTYALYRSDIPFLSDRKMNELSSGGSLDVEVGVFTIGVFTDVHVGASLNGNFAYNQTNVPMAGLGNRKAHNKAADSSFEPYYYKMSGEMTVDTDNSADNYMGKNELVTLDWQGDESLSFGNNLKTQSGATLPNVNGRNERKARTNSLQPITNRDLLSGGAEILPQYRVKYYNNNQPTNITSYASDPASTVNRPLNDQIAGYTTISPSGSKWNYALPVMNVTQIDAMFSIDRPSSECVKRVNIPTTGTGDIAYKVENTDEFLDMTKIPSYASSYLLTSVVGADYVDTDPSDGEPNDNDLGYWVKIEYNKTSDKYGWRTPYTGATYVGGMSNKDVDDKGAFSYGEREQFYPARMISKTHIAEFYYSKRNDGRGAHDMLQTSTIYGDFSYKLDKIAIYTKAEKALAFAESRTPIAMKTVNFQYNYKHCKGIENNAVSGGGKLMLEKVWFTYENTSRGALNPYKFDYNNGDTTATYKEFMFDRWGVYKPIGGDDCQNIHTPFVKQNDTEANIDANVKIWHLTDIYLPSGSHIKVDIGRDHYSHEQDRVAGQMFQLKGVESNGDNTVPTNANPSDGERKIIFDLETPISNAADIDKYFTDLYEDEHGKQLFFQINVDLLNKSVPQLNQDVSGYAHIKDYGVDASSLSGGYYSRGYITLKNFLIPNKQGNFFHPFAMTGWQFIKLNLSDLMYGNSGGTTPVTDQEKQQAARSLLAAFSSLQGLFSDYYAVCSSRAYSSVLNLNKCFIRLNTPDRKMYGGGVRVKKIVMYDHWSEEAEDIPAYGTIYEYEEENPDGSGQLISSGTASGTPMVGKQESSLRYVKMYEEDLKYRQHNLQVIEYPLNESYYPGAGIGYRKVTAKSLATDYAIKKQKGATLPTELPNDLPNGFATSGVTIHEFYTYKDFPVITKETPVESHSNGRKYKNTFFGSSYTNTYATSQGYGIELNNMHGVPYRISHFGQDALGNLITPKISEVTYEYLHRTEVYTEGSKTRERKVLTNNVNIITSDENPSNTTQAKFVNNVEMGVEREFFVDTRETVSYSLVTGVDFNVDVMFVLGFAWVVPIPFFPTNTTEETLRTAVTNKVIRRAGILSKVTAYDGQSRVETENKYFDQYTGQALLTTVNNSFDNPVYNYNIPGRFMYEGMGAAYENWGFTFSGNINSSANCDGYYPLTVSSGVGEKLNVGDEYIVTGTSFKTKATLLNKTLTPARTGYNLRLAFETVPSGSPSSVDFMVIRSGKRNHLTSSIGNITALSDPTINRSINTCTVKSYGIASQTSTICNAPAWADEFITFLNEYVAEKDSLDLCDSVCFYKLSGGSCSVPSVSTAWSAFWHAMQCTGDSVAWIQIPYSSSCTTSTGYLSEILCYTSTFGSSPSSGFSKLVNIASGYNINAPSTSLSASAINDTLAHALRENRILGHELYGCNSSTLDILVHIARPNGFEDAYVVHLSKVACRTSFGTTITTTTYKPDSNDIDTMSIVYKTLDNVLSISAATYRDNWDLSTRQCSSSTAQLGINMFQTGTRGIFRQLESWAYVANRNQSSPINLETDGAMDDVPLFNWTNPMAPFCPELAAWKKTSTVTKYSGKNEAAVESKNIIDQYSGALYGYNGILPLAVAANANSSEIAYEGFEEHNTTSNTSTLTSKESGNFRFIYNSCSTTNVVTYPLYGIHHNSGTHLVLNTPANTLLSSLPQKAVVSLVNALGQTFQFEVNVSSINVFNANSTTSYSMLTLSSNLSCFLPASLSTLDIYGINFQNYIGNVSLYYHNPTPTPTGTFALVDSVAHTGTKSLRLPAGLTRIPQNTIEFVLGKQYVISCWIYTGDKSKHTYAADFELLANRFSSIVFVPSGPVIDGWQRVEGIFTYVGNTINFRFNNKTANPIFMDDIRISPKDAAMQTYVYDPISYRVTEVLDNNNYFARYKYDRQGSPISVQKETVRGIKTIQETGSYLKKN